MKHEINQRNKDQRSNPRAGCRQDRGCGLYHRPTELWPLGPQCADPAPMHRHTQTPRRINDTSAPWHNKFADIAICGVGICPRLLNRFGQCVGSDHRSSLLRGANYSYFARSNHARRLQSRLG